MTNTNMNIETSAGKCDICGELLNHSIWVDVVKFRDEMHVKNCAVHYDEDSSTYDLDPMIAKIREIHGLSENEDVLLFSNGDFKIDEVKAHGIEHGIENTGAHCVACRSVY